jgi:CheY-like chemotaxis protein
MAGGVRKLRRDITPDATNSVAKIKGDGDTRAQKTESHLRILVVEDNRDSADCLRLMLRVYGYDVTVAYSGSEGIQAAEKCQPHIVLCDIGLPALDGYEVARKLRESPTTAKACLIAVTAYGQEEDRRRSYKAGFDHHLVKPVDPDVLLRVLKLVGGSEAIG